MGGIEVLDAVSGEFDLITMSHVIEHVHDPIGLLHACHRLLRPGGRIWIETPNLDSIGHSAYGASWRGLEPPRHLVLFTYGSLRVALSRVGFQGIHEAPYRPVCADIFSASEAMSIDAASDLSRLSVPEQRMKVRAAEREESRSPARREFITLRAATSIS